MKKNDYIVPRFSFSPALEAYKKLNFNPKMYKIAKMYSKRLLNYSELSPPRFSSNEKPLPVLKTDPIVITTESTKFPHLPSLPLTEDSNLVTFRQSRFSHDQNFNKPISPRFLKEKSDKKSGVQVFDFKNLKEFKKNPLTRVVLKEISDKKVENKEEGKKATEKIRRKIIFSKRNQSINVKDFSAGFDYQETLAPIHSSFSSM